MSPAPALGLAVIATLSACVGSIAGQSGSGGTNGSGGAGPGAAGAGGAGQAGAGGRLSVMPPPSALAPPKACTSNAPGPRKLWRLSGPELTASIHSIFEDAAGAAPVATVFSDPVALGFSIDANSLLVQGLNASQLQDNAEAVAAWAAASDKLSLFATCTTQDAACGAQFVQGFGRRAFRTTLAASDARVATYTNLFLAGSSFSDGAQAVVAAMLQSPYFLYRSELGTHKQSTYSLTPYEVATELAYLVTQNTPDETLLAAADSVANGGGLSLSAMIDQQATRLLATASSSNATAIMGFIRGWLGLDRLYTTAKDDTVFKLADTMRDNMALESQNLILEAFNGNRDLGALLTADHTFLNKDLADYYGISAPGLGTSFMSVPLAGTGRDPGLLATGTILNGYARPGTDSPTQRGHMIRSRMLCQDVPPPPANVDTMFKPSATTETTRQHFVNEHSVSGCASCHKMMDWIGFAFEGYDGFGRHRTTDNGLPVDVTATIFGDPTGKDANLTGLSGPGSLSEYLAQSDDVRRCMMRYWTYYAYGSSSWAEDGCTYDAVYKEASSGAFALKNVLMAIIHAPNFTSRVQDR